MAILQPGQTCWRIEPADRAAFLIDDQDYYAALAEALRRARRQVLVLGWSFDPRTRLMPDGRPDPRAPDAVGRLLMDLAEARPGLEVKVLIWRSALAVSATQDFFPHRAKAWFRGSRVDFRLDDSVPFGACHHQKVIVIDDAIAFCGSGDLCLDRWDTPAHSDQDARRRGLWTFNPPRHEVTLAVEGPAAAALGDLARARWLRAGGAALSAPEGPPPPDLWPESLRPSLSRCRLGIARTQPAWRGQPLVAEAGELTLAAIASARRSIYLESQYFASPVTAEALAARLAEPEGPEVVLVTTSRSASYFDRMTMDRTRAALLWRLRSADVFGRFRAYAPTTSAGRAVVVHAKVMVIDDALARVGSANLNNRSAGFDTECDLAVEAADAEQRQAVTHFRDALAGHWVGRPAAAMAEMVERTGGLIQAMEAFNRTVGRLRSFEPRKLGPYGQFVAALNLGDPAGAEDSWKPLRRRERLYARIRALKEPSGQLEVHDQGQVVGGGAGEGVVGRPHGQDPDPGTDEHMVDAQDRHG